MKYVWKILGALFLLILIGGSIFLFLLWSRAPDMVASKLSKQLRTKVAIGDLSISLSALTVDRFEIYNPPNFAMNKALSVERIVIQAPPTRFLHDPIKIDEITADHIYIGLEFNSPKSAKGNWSTLLRSAQTSQEENKKSASNKSVLIKRLVLKNIQADLYYKNEQKTRRLKPIQQIELHNISSQGGDIGDQLMRSALGEAVKQIFIEENLKETLDNFLQSPLKDSLSPLKGLFGAELLDPSP